jgi:hypothetical protein
LEHPFYLLMSKAVFFSAVGMMKLPNIANKSFENVFLIQPKTRLLMKISYNTNRPRSSFVMTKNTTDDFLVVRQSPPLV